MAILAPGGPWPRLKRQHAMSRLANGWAFSAVGQPAAPRSAAAELDADPCDNEDADACEADARMRGATSVPLGTQQAADEQCDTWGN